MGKETPDSSETPPDLKIESVPVPLGTLQLGTSEAGTNEAAAEQRWKEYRVALGERIHRLQRREYERELRDLEERGIQPDRCCLTAPICCCCAPLWVVTRIFCPTSKAFDWFEGYLWWLKGGGERPESPPPISSEE